jgi:hypothetical protein
MSRLEPLAVAILLQCAPLSLACNEPANRDAPAPSAEPAAEPQTETAKAPEPAAPAAPEPAAPPPAAPATPAPEPAAAKQRAASAEQPIAEPPASKAAAVGPCGEEGQPACPLQGWMERHLQQALDDGDLGKVAQGLARVPKFVPDPGWNSGEQGWTTIAETGAAAARQADASAVRQSCKTCHKTWRSKYKASFRQRPIAD